MRRILAPLCVLALLTAACSRGPIPTREINFYRTPDLNGGRGCAVQVIYPPTQQFEDVLEIGPVAWFTNRDLADKVRKEKVWLDPKEVGEYDRPLRVMVDEKAKGPNKGHKQKKDPYMVIFAEYNPKEPPPAGHDKVLIFKKGMKPKARKVEYIRVHNGSLERLPGKP